MTFFARPILEDNEFKQLPNSVLTLSGQTRIANVTGFSISDGTTYVPIIVTGGTNYEVLTLINGQIVLHTPTSGTSSGTYTCASPTTVAVGGLAAGCAIYGCTISKILEEILVPTVSPTISAPFSTYSINPATLYYEAGCTAVITGCITFNRGCIGPQYCGTCCFRSGLPNTHKYQNFDGTFCCCSTSALNSSFPMARTISIGANTSYGNVCYNAGPTPAYNSDGSVFSPALSAGATSPISAVVCGLLPWYWGLSTSNNVNGACIAAYGRAGLGGKCIGLSTGTLPITYNSLSSDYLWFAVPSGTPAKTAWFVCASNQGCIGGSNNLFASSCPQTVTTAFGCVCPYNVYVTCITTGTAPGVPMCMS